MQQKELVRRVCAACADVAEKIGVEIWDVTFEKEGPRHVLTVIIDRESGIDIEDCEIVSRTLDPMLDAPEFDSLPSYTLSVSSAGMERVLRTDAHFEWATGKAVEVSFYALHDGEKSLVGKLEKCENGAITIDGKTYEKAEVASVREWFDYRTIGKLEK